MLSRRLEKEGGGGIGDDDRSSTWPSKSGGPELEACNVSRALNFQLLKLEAILNKPDSFALPCKPKESGGSCSWGGSGSAACGGGGGGGVSSPLSISSVRGNRNPFTRAGAALLEADFGTSRSTATEWGRVGDKVVRGRSR